MNIFFYYIKINEIIAYDSPLKLASHAQKYCMCNNISQEQKKRKSICDVVLSQSIQVHFNPPINMSHPGHLNPVNMSHQISPITVMMESNHINHINHHSQYNEICQMMEGNSINNIVYPTQFDQMQ